MFKSGFENNFGECGFEIFKSKPSNIQIQIHKIWQKLFNLNFNPNPDLELPTIVFNTPVIYLLLPIYALVSVGCPKEAGLSHYLIFFYIYLMEM